MRKYSRSMYLAMAVLTAAALAATGCRGKEAAPEEEVSEEPEAVSEDPDSAGGSAEAAEAAGGLFSDGMPMEFLFASGAGAWGTTLTLHADGAFEGIYEDSENDAATEYPYGTVYICNFTGRFSEMTQESDGTYSMTLEDLDYEEAGREWIEDEIRYISAEPNGLAGGENFVLYVPGTPVDGLDEEFLSWWPDAYLWREGTLDALSSYGLWNKETGAGFFTCPEDIGSGEAE